MQRQQAQVGIKKSNIIPKGCPYCTTQGCSHKSSATSNSEYNVVTSKGILPVSPKCHCDFAVSMKLPCRHIFALRKELNLPIYDVNLGNKNWSRKYYLKSQCIFQARAPQIEDLSMFDNTDISVTLDESGIKESILLFQHEKYRKACGVAQRLASLASEASKEHFCRCIENLQEILWGWQQGREVTVKDVKSSNHENVMFAQGSLLAC